MTPLVGRSEYPKANTVDIPWWWSVDDEAQLRHRLEKLIEGGDVSELETVDHGVVSAPMATVRSGPVGWGGVGWRPRCPDSPASGTTRRTASESVE